MLGRNLKPSPKQRKILYLALCTVLSSVLVFGFMFKASWRLRQRRLNQRIVAEFYAEELLEYFRAMDSISLTNYLKQNNARMPANLHCTPINVLNRSTSQVLNRDPAWPKCPMVHWILGEWQIEPIVITRWM